MILLMPRKTPTQKASCCNLYPFRQKDWFIGSLIMQECASPYPPQEGVAESWGQEALRGQPALQTALSRAGGWLLMGGTTYQLLHGLSHSVLSNHLVGVGRLPVTPLFR